jgi:hypothetical protein
MLNRQFLAFVFACTLYFESFFKGKQAETLIAPLDGAEHWFPGGFKELKVWVVKRLFLK